MTRKSALWIGTVFLTAILAASCRPTDKPRRVNEVNELSADLARQALVAMLEEKDAPNFDTRPHEVAALRAGKNFLVVSGPQNSILSGTWTCELMAKTFSFTTQIGSCLYSCNGVFEFTDQGWRGRVTEHSWGHFKSK